MGSTLVPSLERIPTSSPKKLNRPLLRRVFLDHIQCRIPAERSKIRKQILGTRRGDRVPGSRICVIYTFLRISFVGKKARGKPEKPAIVTLDGATDRLFISVKIQIDYG